MVFTPGYPQISGSLSSLPIRGNFGFLNQTVINHASSSLNPHNTTLDQVSIANPVTDQQITVKGINTIRFADQFATIQAAINDLPVSGGTVYISSGSYGISSPTLLRDNLSFIGEGIGITVLQLISGSNCDIIDLGTNTQNIFIENITLDGNRDNQGGDETIYNMFGIIGSIVGSNIFIRNVEVKNCKEQGIAINGDNIRIEGCIVTNSKWNGITLGGHNNVIINTTTSRNEDDGIEITSYSSGSIVSNCICLNEVRGIFVHGAKNVTVNGCIISGSSVYGIDVWSNGPEVCENVVVSSNSLYNSGIGIIVGVQNGGIVKNCTIVGNSVEYSPRSGIVISNASGMLISSNTVYNCGRSDAFNAAITLEDSSYNLVIGNKCFDDRSVKTQRYGYQESGTSDYNKVLSNDFSGNLVGEIYIIVGANTFIQDIKNNRFEFNKDIYTDSNVTSSEDILTAHGDLYIRTAGAAYEDEGYLYFLEGIKRHHLKYSYPDLRFEFDDDLNVSGSIVTDENLSTTKPANIYSLLFGADADYVDLGNIFNIASGSTWTAECWFKLTDLNTSYGILGFDGGGPISGFLIREWVGYLWLVIGNGTTETVIYLTCPAAGAWHHVAATYDGTYLRLYLDGILQGSPTSGPYAPYNGTKYIGKSNTNNLHLRGNVDEVRLWSVARTAAQILANKDLVLTGSEGGLDYYWKCEEGSGALIHSSATAGDGTLVGGTTFVADTSFPAFGKLRMAKDSFTFEDLAYKNDRWEFSDNVYVNGNISAQSSGSVLKSLNVINDLQVGGKVVGNLKCVNNIYVKFTGPDEDSYIYFYENGSPTGAYLKWVEGLGGFKFSHSLETAAGFIAAGNVTCGNIYANENIVINDDFSDHDAILAFNKPGGGYGILKWNKTNNRFEFDESLCVSKNFTMGGNLTVSGSVQVGGNISGNANLYIDGNITASGFIGIPIDICMFAPAAATTWTNQPAALTNFLGILIHGTFFDLTQAKQARLIVQLSSNGAGNGSGAELRVQYSLDTGTWYYLDNVSGPKVVFAGSGTLISDWVNLDAGAKADVYLRLVGINGDGVKDPIFGAIHLQIR